MGGCGLLMFAHGGAGMKGFLLFGQPFPISWLGTTGFSPALCILTAGSSWLGGPWSGIRESIRKLGKLAMVSLT